VIVNRVGCADKRSVRTTLQRTVRETTNHFQNILRNICFLRLPAQPVRMPRASAANCYSGKKHIHSCCLALFNFPKNLYFCQNFLLMELVVYIKNEQDLVVLERLLTEMKLRFEHKSSKKEEAETSKQSISAKRKLEDARTRLLQLREDGVDVSSYGDPIQWQRDMPI
jgi:hypothetical protein